MSGPRPITQAQRTILMVGGVFVLGLVVASIALGLQVDDRGFRPNRDAVAARAQSSFARHLPGRHIEATASVDELVVHASTPDCDLETLGLLLDAGARSFLDEGHFTNFRCWASNTQIVRPFVRPPRPAQVVTSPVAAPPQVTPPPKPSRGKKKRKASTPPTRTEVQTATPAVTEPVTEADVIAAPEPVRAPAVTAPVRSPTAAPRPSYTAPSPSYSVPNCKKGCPCGNSCISCSKTCRK